MYRLSIMFAGALTVSALALAAPAFAAPEQMTRTAPGVAVAPRFAPAPTLQEAVVRSPHPKPPAAMLVDDHGFRGGHEEGEEHEGGEGHVFIGGGFGGPGWGFGWGPYWGPAWGPGYYGPGYGYGFGYDHASGALKLKVTGPNPKRADVYANGNYVGTVDDFNGFFQELNLRPGQYHMEIRAKGYKDLDFSVHIRPGRTITYHGDLQPAA